MNADFDVVLGDGLPNVVVLLEFTGKAEFDDWWTSDEYAELKSLRENSALPVSGSASAATSPSAA